MRLFRKSTFLEAGVLEINIYSVQSRWPELAERFVVGFEGYCSRATPSFPVFPLYTKERHIEIEWAKELK